MRATREEILKEADRYYRLESHKPELTEQEKDQVEQESVFPISTSSSIRGVPRYRKSVSTDAWRSWEWSDP